MNNSTEKILCLQDEVEEYIKKEGLLKKKFAEKIGITAPMFSYWLSGKANLSTEKLNKICDLISGESGKCRRKEGIDIVEAKDFVRRIDDLGRVQIPKEIREKLGIKDGDSLMISTDEEKGIISLKRLQLN